MKVSHTVAQPASGGRPVHELEQLELGVHHTLASGYLKRLMFLTYDDILFTYNIQDGLLGKINIISAPFVLNPREAYTWVNNCGPGVDQSKAWKKKDNSHMAMM
jgi:hypothetical protein